MKLKKIITVIALTSFMGAGAVETVTVSEAGQLSETITEARKHTISELKVSGPINGADIAFLRDMAGVDQTDYETVTDGILTNLDLSDATIVKGGYYINSRYSWERGEAADNTIGDNMWRNSKLSRIVLPQNIAIIGTSAFSMTPLTSIVIPDGVTSLGNDAFSGCTALVDIDIAPSVNSIGSNCFENCSSLTYVKVPDITSLKDMTFSGCVSLTRIDLPATLTEMSYSPSLPDGLETLQIAAVTPPTAQAAGSWSGSFKNIDKEKCTVYVPVGKIDAYKSAVGWNEFKKFAEIEEHVTRTEIDVTLTDAGTLSDYVSDADMATVKKLKVAGPLNGSDLRLIRAMAGKDERWNDTPGVLADLDMTDAVMVEGGDNICVPLGMETSTNPEWIVAYANALPEELFSYTTIETVKLPTSIKKIYSSFSDATKLGGDIVVPEGVEIIGEWAFSNTRISSITLPSTLCNEEGTSAWFNNVAIGAHAFENCENLTGISLPSGVTIIKESTFEGCAAMTEFHLPVNVTTIASQAFARSGIRNFYVETFEPIKAEYNAFYGFDTETCVLHVPAHSAEAYRNAAEWSNFVNIVEGEATAAEFTVTTTSADFSGVTVTVDGQPVVLSGTSVTLAADLGSVAVVTPSESAVINAVTAEGASVKELEDGSFRVVITATTATLGIDWEPAVVKVAVLPSYVNGEITGSLLLSYEGENVESVDLPLGATVTFVAEPSEGYVFDHVTRVADGSDDSVDAGSSYTAVRADMVEEVLFKAVFTKKDSGVSTITADLDADTPIAVFTPAGVCVMSATAATFDYSILPAGIYMVKVGDNVVKIAR